MRLISIFCLIAAAATAAPLKFSSGEGRTHLLELFSSEGCSSCPPAEAWLAGLRDAAGLWRDFVPVAFPVTYWDKLGWPDRFASKEFTARQYNYAAEWGGDSVYTPEFVLNGAEWRLPSNRNPPPASPEKAGVLTAVYKSDGSCRVEYAGAADGNVHLALLGGGIVSDVRAGENRGRKLGHEFVVLVLQSTPLKDGVAELQLPPSSDRSVRRHALAVWVTRAGKLTPLQATGGWLD